MQFEQCFAPGEDIGCGACSIPPSTCQVDAECTAMGSAFICAVARCTCNTDKSCIAGCLDDSGCGEGLTCGLEHRCVPSACSDASGCPIDFDCTSNGCIRRRCTSDDVCQGACVKGQCYPTLGFCSSLPS